jgi:metal-responsive CopG/Arc/MetJ family transcriptional regulator
MRNAEKRDITVSLPKDLHEKFQKYCEEQGETMSSVVRALIRKALS